MRTFFVVIALILGMSVSASAQQNCMSLEPSVRAQLEPWFAKGTGLFENPFADRFNWCIVTSQKDWTGDGTPDVLLFRALRDFDRRADVWVTAWLPLRGNAAPLVTRFTFKEVMPRVSYKGFLWNPENQGWFAFYSDTIHLGFGGVLFARSIHGRPDQTVLDWLIQNFGIEPSRATSVLPEYFWKDAKTFTVRYR